VQYAVVRVNGIVRKGTERLGDVDAANLRKIESGEIDAAKFLAAPANDDLWDLALLAGSLDARVDAAVGAQEPAFLARYAFDLAQVFNIFYHKHRILSEEDAERRAFLLRLTQLVKDQLVKALDLLGIKAPERM
jgi:arginyl-tRNA synthetase